MTKQPLVSVIIPVLNAEPYLRETLASVLSQTYPNIEIIVIDDGSTDNSYELAKKHNAPNIILKKNIGKGACAARNYGFTLSTGDYIQYLDADDMLSPRKIEKQVIQLLRMGNNHIANCRWGRFYENKDNVQWKEQPIDVYYDNPSQWLADSWLGGGMGQTAVWLSPRIIIGEVGPWNEDLQLNQDGEFFCRVLLKSQGITFVKDCGVYYRSGLAQSISKINIMSKKKAESLLLSYQLYRIHIESFGFSSNLKTALGNNFLMFMYQYDYIFPDLSAMAEKEFFTLGHKETWPVGGILFQNIARILGFKNALRLKSLSKLLHDL